MKLFIIAIFCLTAAFAAPPKVDAENWKIYKVCITVLRHVHGVSLDLSYFDVFLTLQEAYDKVYEREEEGIRMGIFTRKIQQIRAHNELFKQGKVTFTLGVNQFADMVSSVRQLVRGGAGNQARTLTSSVEDHVRSKNII